MAALESLRDDDWMNEAKCQRYDPELFFPAKGGDAFKQSRVAKAICYGLDGKPPCPVLTECGEYAIRHNERFGVWGGLSEGQRAMVRRRRRRTKLRVVRLPRTPDQKISA